MVQQLAGIQGLMEKTKQLGLSASEPDAVRAGAGEFILEGLYAHKRISRNEEAGFTAGERRREPPDEGKAETQKAISVKSIRYGRYTGEDFGLSTEDLLKALADFFLNSGFDNPYMRFSEFNQHTLEDLKRALEDAILNGEMFDPERAEQIRKQLENMSGEEIDQLLNRLVQKLVDEGYINTEPQNGGPGGEGDGEVEVQITDKSIDFLGYKTLKDLLGSLGRSSFGAHDTRDMATGVEASGASKVYEFGDSMNLDVNTTLFSALSREGAEAADQSGVSRSARASIRVSEFVCHGVDARLQPQHDPLRRRPLHAGEESGDGAGASDPHPVSRRFAALRAVPRFRRGTAH